MNFELERSIGVLERTPGVLRAMLGGQSDFWVMRNYGEGTFSPFDVVGHLIEGEKHNWMVRLRLMLAHGEAKAFAPFGRYAMYEANRGKGIEELLEQFAKLRGENVVALKGLGLGEGGSARLGTAGMHPELGRVTVRELIAAWVVHDLGHTHQIAKAMAYQYREDVGPWRAYLTILPRG